MQWLVGGNFSKLAALQTNALAMYDATTARYVRHPPCRSQRLLAAGASLARLGSAALRWCVQRIRWAWRAQTGQPFQVYALAATSVFDTVAGVKRNAVFVGGTFQEKMNVQVIRLLWRVHGGSII